MRLTASLLALVSIALSLSATAQARPRTERDLPRIREVLPSPPAPSTGVLQTAQQGTTYFGGTVWAPDSMRWEAIPGGTWTFDSGVGSFLVEEDPLNPGHPKSYPHVNPYKTIGLHGGMEGWVGFDLSFSESRYFRRLGDTDPRWGGDVCVGTAAGLGGSYSFWAGVMASETNELCFANDHGYGNSWILCLAQEFEYIEGTVTFQYSFTNDTEPYWDFTYVTADTTGEGDETLLNTYTGTVSGTETMTLAPGFGVPSSPGPVTIKFCVVTDAAYSDEDGYYPSSCGAFAVDDILLQGGIVHSADFETGDDGWGLLPPTPGQGGDWSNLVHLSDLPPTLTPCSCDIQDSVLVFNDLTLGQGHGVHQDNLAASPWIDLLAAGATAPGKFVEHQGYFDLNFYNFVFGQVQMQWYPDECLRTGKLVTSPWTSVGLVFAHGGVPVCFASDLPFRVDFSAVVPPGAEQVRIALGVLAYCRYAPALCTGVSNSTPWFDNVRLGVYGNPGAPMIDWSMANDAFPENGSLQLDAPGRFDVPFWRGDTLIVWGAEGGAEVHVQFEVIPGPGVDPARLSDFFGKFYPEGDGWYSARMDTAEQGGFAPNPGRWMTAFHEDDPGFTGSDTDLDPNDVDPQGNICRLANDMFPDDLFTPGTRIHYFFKTRYVGSTTWFTAPDTTGLFLRPSPDVATPFFEWECLPSSMSQDTTWNCVLFVNAPDWQFSWTQYYLTLEPALQNLLGSGSPNFENRRWDRWDRWDFFGRPLGEEYGATVTQTLGYKTILWASGMGKVDGDILVPWIALPGFEYNNLYITGNNLVTEAALSPSVPSVQKLLNELCGVEWNCSTFRDAECPTGTPQDMVSCADLEPVTGANVADPVGRTVIHQAWGNGCPSLVSFDVLGINTDPAFGVAKGDEQYVGGVKTAQYASVSNNAEDLGPLSYKTVVDGVSAAYRRDAGLCERDVAAPTALEERLQEVLAWFGYLGGEMCSDPTVGIGVPGPARPLPHVTALQRITPNPLRAGGTGTIRFTLAQEGRATLEIFDINGRLVRSVFDGAAAEGVNQVQWDGTDAAGRPLASGIYFYQLRAGDRRLSRKVVLLGGSR